MKHLILAVTVALSFSAQAAPIPKADQDTLHGFFLGVNHFNLALGVAEGAKFDNLPPVVTQMATLMKTCTMHFDKDTTIFGGDTGCPITITTNYTDNNKNPDITSVEDTAIIAPALAVSAGINGFDKKDNNTTINNNTTGLFHTDGTSGYTYTIASGTVTMNETTTLDGIVKKNHNEIDVSISHLKTSSIIGFGNGKSVQIGLELQPNSPLKCVINQQPGDCRQLAYILAMDSQTDLINYFKTPAVESLR